MYQQQMYMQQQQEQMRRMAYEQDILRQEVEKQKRERMELEKKRQKASERREISSRDRERDALALLSAFEKSTGSGGGGRGLDDLLGDISRPPSKPSIPKRMETPITHGYQGQQPPMIHHSQSYTPNTFQQTANMMFNSPNYYSPYGGGGGGGGSNPYQQQPTQPFTYPGTMNGGSDMNFIMKLLEMVKGEQDSKPKRNKLSDMMMNSLEKQNQILTSLAKNITEEKEDRTHAENKDLERKIKKLELESEMKKHHLIEQNTWDRLANNFNSKTNILDEILISIIIQRATSTI